MGGTPCLRGTRLSIYAVKARIAGGESVSELFTGYPPEFGEDHVRAAIDYADRVPFSEASDSRPWRSATTR